MTCSSILLDHFLELTDSDIDFPDCGHLLLGSGGNLLDQVGCRPDHRHGPLQQAAGILGDCNAFLGKIADLLGSGLTSFRELADLAGDDGEPFTMSTGASRLDGGIQARRLVW